MVELWSEWPGARLREQIADLATLLWVAIEPIAEPRAAQRAIRTAPGVADAGIESTLAMRAICRLDDSALPDYTPDPLRDWAGGRHDRLARAELASVGLRP